LLSSICCHSHSVTNTPPNQSTNTSTTSNPSNPTNTSNTSNTSNTDLHHEIKSSYSPPYIPNNESQQDIEKSIVNSSIPPTSIQLRYDETQSQYRTKKRSYDEVIIKKENSATSISNNNNKRICIDVIDPDPIIPIDPMLIDTQEIEIKNPTMSFNPTHTTSQIILPDINIEPIRFWN
jgi:hypothetical protein